MMLCTINDRLGPLHLFIFLLFASALSLLSLIHIYALNDNNHIFGRYTYERESQGQPQVPYYSPGAVMGSVNTPGGGVINAIHVHSAAANYARVFSPTLTNEVFATLVYFTQDFEAKTPSALTKAAINYPYNGIYDNGSKDFPMFEDYGYDGLPIAIQPDFTYGAPSLKLSLIHI